MRNHFELFAHGVAFDVDGYISGATLEFNRIWHRGEGEYVTNGVAKVLGDGASIPFYDQQHIAVEFLSSHRDALRELANYPGVETFILGLHCQLPLEDDLTGFCMGMSRSLMWHALDIGIEPTSYVVLDRPKRRRARRA